jgi:enoyl-CoA hydratase/carnithine racemase
LNPPERLRRYRYLNLTRDGHVVTCTLSNPPNHTLTAAGVREILQVLDDVEADTSVRAYRGGAGKTPYEWQGE